MAQAFDYFGDSKDALRMLIPVMINENNVTMREKRLDELSRIEKEKLDMEREKLDETKKARLQEWKLKSLSGMAEKFIAEGDTENLKKLAEPMAEFGIDLSQFVSPGKTMKPPTSAAGLAFQLGGGDPDKVLDNWRKMHPPTSDKNKTADEFLMDKAKGDVNEFIRLKNLLRPESGGKDQRLQAALSILRMKDKDELNPMMATMMDMINPGSSEKYLKAQREGKPADLSDLRNRAMAIVNEGLGKQSPGGEMPQMPDAKQHKGRTIRDTESGKKFRSDGNQWIELGAE